MGVIDQAAGLRATFEARRACWGAEPRALVWQPAPPAAGDAAAARRLAQGVLLFGGEMRILPAGTSPWTLDCSSPAWAEALHGHGWLDDLAASQHAPTRKALIGWVHDWIATFGQGTGPGWRPDLAARRLIRWIAHATDLLNGADRETSQAFFRTLSAHARFLDRRWRHTRPGTERIEALAGQIYARLSLEAGMPAETAIQQFGQAAETAVDADGGLSSRNPEDVLRLVELLGWSAGIVEAAGKACDPGHLAALSRLLPTLSALTHADGRLARFHGGRAGAVGAVARAVEAAPVAAAPGLPGSRGEAMGFLRLTGGDATLIVDAAPPPDPGAHMPHASPLAIEFTHGRHPIIVSAGPGRAFGLETAREGAQMASQSCLALETGLHGPADLSSPVSARLTEEANGTWALGESHAFHALCGLRHERRLNLSADGLGLSGEDTLIAGNAEDRAKLSAGAPPDLGPRRFAALFLMHPDLDVAPALNGRAALIVLPDGAKWMLRTDSKSVAIRPASYFESGRTHPRATKQVVVSGEILEYWARVTWSLDRLAAPPA
ncbi:MAG: heparinase II/III family protein [Pseudomonadota bacterium]